jgi:lysozyme family protein
VRSFAPAPKANRRTASALVPSRPIVTAADDAYEHEADRVAEDVIRGREPLPERRCACGGGCPACRDERAGSPSIASAILSSSGQPLDAATSAFMESRLGHDFSQVRIHTGPLADSAARAVQARAFTLHRDIVFAEGQYDPHGTRGRQLLAHELTHVLQQRSAAGGGIASAVSLRAPAGSLQRKPAGDASADDAAFWEWWKLVVGFEGSLDAWKKQPANKNDRGGQTNWGVTKQTYMLRAKALGLDPTEAGFAAMTPDQAMLFGRMLWKSSGASSIKNTGVAIVLADWYWGGIDLDRFKNLLKEKGRAATFNMGMPDAATLDFMNTLPPSELIELMSNAKAAQYRKIVEKDPKQKEFLEGWLKRNEARRQQAQPFIPGQKAQPVQQTGASLLEHGRRALIQARAALDMGDAGADARTSARSDVWEVVGAIDEQQVKGFGSADEERAAMELKRALLKELGRLMDASTRR